MAAPLDLLTVTPRTLADLSDEELFALHASFAEAWRKTSEGEPLPMGLNREEFVNRFAFVVDEFNRRKLKRPNAPGLDQALARLSRSDQREGQTMDTKLPHPLDETACVSLLGGMPDEVVLAEDFVRFGGDFLNKQEADDGVDILLRDGFKDSSRDLKLFRIVKAATNREATFVLCPEGFPPGDHIEGYDLVLRKCQPGLLNIVNEPEFQSRLYASAPEELSTLLERRDALASSLVDFVAVPAFVSVTGSYIYHAPDREANDLDVVVKCWDEREDVIAGLEEAIRSASGKTLHWVWEPRGPNWSWLPLFDLVCRARTSERHTEQMRALKVPDPEFIVKRLAAGKEALILSGADRSSLAENEWVLINERLKEGEPTRAWGVVTFKQDEEPIKDFEALGARREGVDNLSTREFSSRRGPFFVLKLKLVRRFEPAKILPGTVPGRRFAGKIKLAEAFHIRGTHWVPVPESGSCPAEFPTMGDFPDSDRKVCFTKDAAKHAAEARMREVVASRAFDNYFEIVDGKARDLGNKTPTALKPIPSDQVSYAIVRKDSEKGTERAEVLEGVSSEEARAKAKEIAEKEANPNLVVILGRAMGSVEDRVIYRDQIGYVFKESRLSEDQGRVPSGLHDHPHPPDGKHTHVGFPEDTGSHAHTDPKKQPFQAGGHAHKEGDPVEGWHLGDPNDEGAHVHIIALKDSVPELWEWFTRVVGAHWPVHKWLEGHKETWIQHIGIEPELRPTTERDWTIHSLWSMHSAGASLQQHVAVFLDPKTRFLRRVHKFQDGTEREATMEDFEKEVAWFNEHLPFPEEAVLRKLGESAIHFTSRTTASNTSVPSASVTVAGFVGDEGELASHIAEIIREVEQGDADLFEGMEEDYNVDEREFAYTAYEPDEGKEEK